MSTSKKTPQKAQDKKPAAASPKYTNGQLVFFIDRGRSKVGEVLQAEVIAWRSSSFNLVDAVGKKTGCITDFEYDLRTAYGDYEEISEIQLYPNLTAVSLAFTKGFVHLLK